jgi:hypothetical protein
MSKILRSFLILTLLASAGFVGSFGQVHAEHRCECWP